VSVAIAPSLNAAIVVFAIDGREDGWATGPEWETVLGFGETLEPHVVTATAYDHVGRAVAIATRRVNVPQAPARLEILLEHEPETDRPVAAGSSPQASAEIAPFAGDFGSTAGSSLSIRPAGQFCPF
jgi:hypothetical protein